MRNLDIIILIIMAACMLPYIFAFIARIYSGYDASKHDNPREFLNQQTGFVARANAAQQNSFESLPLFLVAMMMAEYLVVRDTYIIVVGVAYLFFRLLYGLCYLANWSRLRSITWMLATTCPLLLLWQCMKIY